MAAPETRTIRLPTALDLGSIAALAADVTRLSVSPGILVLRGAEPATFCRGLELASVGEAGAREGVRRFVDVIGALASAPVPTIAVVTGQALGGGVGLAAACDWVLASEDATFGLPEMLHGLLPATILPVLLQRMQPRKVQAWALSGYARDARDALAAGLVDEIAAGGDLEPRVNRAARAFGRCVPEAVPRLRAWVVRAATLGLDDGIAAGGEITAGMLANLPRRASLLPEGELP